MQVKVVTAKPNWDKRADAATFVFDGGMSKADIDSQLDMYLLEEAFGEVSILDFDIDYQLQVVRRV